MGHPIPEGRRAVTPYLVVNGADAAIAFYKAAFAAEEINRSPITSEDGSTKVGHAELQIGDSTLFLADEFPAHGAVGPTGGTSPVTLHLCVTDADAAYQRAVAAGATGTMPPADMFWGDRFAKLIDPFGHHWSISEHLEDVSAEEVRKRMAALVGQGCQ